MDRGKSANLLTILDSWTSAADYINEHGTKLIGHEPSVAPKAYRHVVYAGLSPKHQDEFRCEVHEQLPCEYFEFLTVANGMILFSGAIRVLGYVPQDRDGKHHIHNFPPSVLSANMFAPLTKAAGGNFVIGFYKEDGSYVYIDASGRVVRFDYEGDNNLIEQWGSFSYWMESEIERLDTMPIALH